MHKISSFHVLSNHSDRWENTGNEETFRRFSVYGQKWYLHVRRIDCRKIRGRIRDEILQLLLHHVRLELAFVLVADEAECCLRTHYDLSRKQLCKVIDLWSFPDYFIGLNFDLYDLSLDWSFIYSISRNFDSILRKKRGKVPAGSKEKDGWITLRPCERPSSRWSCVSSTVDVRSALLPEINHLAIRWSVSSVCALYLSDIERWKFDIFSAILGKEVDVTYIYSDEASDWLMMRMEPTFPVVRQEYGRSTVEVRSVCISHWNDDIP